MTDSLVIGIPVLARPQNAATVAASILGTAPKAHILFLCSEGDDDELNAVRKTGCDCFIVPWAPGRGDFARKHNEGFRQAFAAGSEWYFVGADDLTFHDGWYEQCLEAHAKTGACVIGTKDLGNKRTMNGWHATHFLVSTDYLECGTVDEDGKLFHEGYHHEFCDDECVATARMRRTYAGSMAIAEHDHPDWGKAEWDTTYRKAQANRAADQALYNSRRHMFSRRSQA